MTMKRSLHSVLDALHALLRQVRELEQVVDDGPATGLDLAVLDALRGHATEIESEVAECAAIVQQAIDAESSGDVAASARFLSGAHERFSALFRRARFGLSAQTILFAIERLSARRESAWRSWSEIVLRGLEQIDDALHHADAALVGAWQEIADVTLHVPTHTNHRKEIVHA